MGKDHGEYVTRVLSHAMTLDCISVTVFCVTSDSGSTRWIASDICAVCAVCGSDWYTTMKLVISVASKRRVAAHGHLKSTHGMVDPPDSHAMGKTDVLYNALSSATSFELEHVHVLSARFEIVNDSRTRTGHIPHTAFDVGVQGDVSHCPYGHPQLSTAVPPGQYELAGHVLQFRFVLLVHGVVS